MTDLSPNFSNKTAFSNYIYYQKIHKNAKRQKGIFILFELIFVYCVYTFYIYELQTVIMPAMIFLIIKEIYVFARRHKRKSVMSFLGNLFTACIMFIQYIIACNPSAADMITFFAILIPIVFTHFSLFKYECIETSFSQLNDYPYFFTHQYDATEENQFTEFDDSKNDKYLKEAMQNIFLNNKNKKIKILRYVFFTGTIISTALTLIFVTRICAAKNTEKYLPENSYSRSSSYVKFCISEAYFSDVINGDSGVDFWAAQKKGGKYITLKTDRSYFEELCSSQLPITVIGKVKNSYEQIHSGSLVSHVFPGEPYYSLSDEKKAYLNDIAYSDIYIKLFNESLTEDIILYSIILAMIFLAAYTFSTVFMKTEKY